MGRFSSACEMYLKLFLRSLSFGSQLPFEIFLEHVVDAERDAGLGGFSACDD